MSIHRVDVDITPKEETYLTVTLQGDNGKKGYKSVDNNNYDEEYTEHRDAEHILGKLAYELLMNNPSGKAYFENYSENYLIKDVQSQFNNRVSKAHDEQTMNDKIYPSVTLNDMGIKLERDNNNLLTITFGKPNPDEHFSDIPHGDIDADRIVDIIRDNLKEPSSTPLPEGTTVPITVRDYSKNKEDSVTTETADAQDMKPSGPANVQISPNPLHDGPVNPRGEAREVG